MAQPFRRQLTPRLLTTPHLSTTLSRQSTTHRLSTTTTLSFTFDDVYKSVAHNYPLIHVLAPLELLNENFTEASNIIKRGCIQLDSTGGGSGKTKQLETTSRCSGTIKHAVLFTLFWILIICAIYATFVAQAQLTERFENYAKKARCTTPKDFAISGFVNVLFKVGIFNDASNIGTALKQLDCMAIEERLLQMKRMLSTGVILFVSGLLTWSTKHSNKMIKTMKITMTDKSKLMTDKEATQTAIEKINFLTNLVRNEQDVDM